jgi:hypothetical protein
MPAPRCPHCHAELHALPDGGVPELCPYCGDELPLDVGPSLATLLRAGPAAGGATAPGDSPAVAPTLDAAAPVQEDEAAVDNRSDATAPEAARTSDPVIDPETRRHATPDANALDPSPIDAADDAARAIPSDAIDNLDTAEDQAAGHATNRVVADMAGWDAAGQDTREDNAATPSPSFLGEQASAAQTRAPRWQWVAAAGLALALCLQLIYVQRDALARDAQWRPWMSRLCGLTGCTLAPWRELSAFHMLGREVRAVAGRRGVLQVQATFRNDAAWPQPLPNLRVSLSDADGRVLGARVLRPADYLPNDDRRALVAPGQSVQASALLGEPDAPSVAFAFEFR